MQLWRISNHADLSGIGGLHGSGRWHTQGLPVVYLGENPALCMLETLVHLDLRADEVPSEYQLIGVDVDARVVPMVLPDDLLHADWRSDFSLTRAVGDEFLRSNQSALLRVPSALVSQQFNYLLNPAHEDALFLTISSVTRHPYDKRLVTR